MYPGSLRHKRFDKTAKKLAIVSGEILYEYDIPVGCPQGITSPREEVIPGGHPTGMSYLF